MPVDRAKTSCIPHRPADLATWSLVTVTVTGCCSLVTGHWVAGHCLKLENR
ncbi:GD17094 [Drosophila simulans]|uniref:GD17094 n=1 Tax=Drosophila simulans TaxID=7240 RepID=B4R409_DROSI|nr:GD17094 [Drosophila simulans]